jgi:mannuronan synthase
MSTTDGSFDAAAALDAFRDEIRDAVNAHLSASSDPPAPAREVEKRAWVRTEPGLAPELRNERQFVRVKLPMEVEHRGATYRGFDISLGGFSVYGHPTIADDAVEDFVVRLLFRGYALTVKVRAAPVRQVQESNLTGFRIVEIEDDQLEVLRRILRAYLGGQLVTLEGLLVAADIQTTRGVRAAAAAAENRLSGKALWRQRAWYGGIALATFALLILLATSLFQRFAMVAAEVAAVTAPKLEVRSPADGEVGPHDLRPDDRVRRDQLLAEIRDRDLELELELVRARVAEAQKLLANPRPGSNLPVPSWPTPLQSALSESEQRSELAATLGLERARLVALEHRIEGNRLYASCDCLVFWAVPAGDWVQRGDRLFTLIRAGPSDLLVEALVPLSAITSIRQHDMAFIELPRTGELIEARVALLALDAERQPRAGLPRSAREDQSLASVLLRPSQALPSDMIGVPVEVVFSRMPEITLLAANLRRRVGDLAPKVLAALGLSGRAIARERP